MSDSENNLSEELIDSIIPTESQKKRGRPPKDPQAHALKVKAPKVEGRGRGRPKKELSPEEAEAKEKKAQEGIFFSLDIFCCIIRFNFILICFNLFRWKEAWSSC